MKATQSWKQTLLVATLVTATSFFLNGCQTAPSRASKPPTKDSQAAMMPAQALERLKEGNQRFVAGHTLPRDLVAERQATAGGQYPFTNASFVPPVASRLLLKPLY